MNRFPISHTQFTNETVVRSLVIVFHMHRYAGRENGGSLSFPVPLLGPFFPFPLGRASQFIRSFHYIQHKQQVSRGVSSCFLLSSRMNTHPKRGRTGPKDTFLCHDDGYASEFSPCCSNTYSSSSQASIISFRAFVECTVRPTSEDLQPTDRELLDKI